MNTDMVVGLIIGIVTTSCVAIQLHYALNRTRARRALEGLRRRIREAQARTGYRDGEEEELRLGDAELDGAAIADQTEICLNEITEYLQKEAGQ